jgi:hypothetical protein
MKYEQLKVYFNRNGSGQAFNLFDYVEKHIPIEEMKLTYSKRFLKPNVDSVGLIVFTNNSIWLFENHEDGRLDTSVIQNYKIEKLKLTQNLEDRNSHAKLQIVLASGEEILLDAEEDTGEDWKHEYTEYVKEIFDYLK